MHPNLFARAFLFAFALGTCIPVLAAESDAKNSKSAAKAEKTEKAEKAEKPEKSPKPEKDGKDDVATASKSDAKAKTKTESKAELSGSTLVRELTVEQLQEALVNHKKLGGKLKILVGSEGTTISSKPAATPVGYAAPTKVRAALSQTQNPLRDAPSDEPIDPNTSRNYIKAKAQALTDKFAKVPHAPADGADHWDYEGSHGPQAWGQMKPEFGTCATGKRQSPINIDDSLALQGPAEPLQIQYAPSNGTVVNNGHTIQVDVTGENTLLVRGTTFKLVQFHAHHPAEERVNNKSFAMVLHLVHRSDDGKLAVIAVLLETGAANPFLQKVWMHMPLDVQDKVRMPANYLNLSELLPADRRYYQFMGSLTTPPCTEGVLWMVLKQPVSLSREQLRVFAQLFPNNARPIQPLQGRVVRSAE